MLVVLSCGFGCGDNAVATLIDREVIGEAVREESSLESKVLLLSATSSESSENNT